MQRETLLFTACILLCCLTLECAAQGGGRGQTKPVTYAHRRDFSQWIHGLSPDPLTLVAFIAAVVSGNHATSHLHFSYVFS